MSNNGLTPEQIEALIEWEARRLGPKRELYEQSLAEAIAIHGQGSDAVRSLVVLGEGYARAPNFSAMDDLDLQVWKQARTHKPQKEDLSVPRGRRSTSRVRSDVRLCSGRDDVA
ncbi:hypothetical protein [Microbacterium sp. Leaf288]|uniref:hypothetical protein n=1 Tax=Microbacterium sp. Leaf288 TaxID=1736323 RepID=UPI000AA4165D|nr:hypothetical protein [Microbacterium sp. Leaf288]